MKMTQTIFSLVLCLLVASSATAQNLTFDSWDTDNDKVIERQEFTSKFVEEFYPLWDSTGTTGIIEEGFFRNVYAGLDTDGDNLLSDEEWLIGYNYFYDDYLVYEDMDLVDVNEDGSVSYDEYYDALYDTDYFTDIDLDSDNYISEYELADYVFNNWDVDDSGTISRSEYNRFDAYYLDV